MEVRPCSIYDLAFAFLERFYTEEPSDEEKRSVLNDIHFLLLHGWTSEDIVKEFKMFLGSFPGVRPNILELFEQLRQSSFNLLTPGAFYYHNQLRIMPGPPKRELDINSGVITKVEEPYFLEMRASYTVENLTDYFLQQSGFTAPQTERKRMIGAFKYLLKAHDIETVLFMIDAGVNAVYSEDLGKEQLSPLKLADYISVAQQQLGEKRTENITAGDDRVVPRGRVLSFRGGGPVGQSVPAELHADIGHVQGV